VSENRPTGKTGRKIVSKGSKGKKDFTEDDLRFELWPLEGEEHPMNYENVVEEAVHDRLFYIAKENRN
jgi:hypothetical protein